MGLVSLSLKNSAILSYAASVTSSMGTLRGSFF
jgi:hypothetical protein